jgi:hypothetical protein
MQQRPLRAFLERALPSAVNALRTWKNRRYFRKRFAGLQREIRERAFPEGTEITVQAGPFKGMRYLDETVWGSITPKWLGSYEAELHPVVEEILRSDYEHIVDVGCAEGYYAVGLALMAHGARVFAFDTDHLSRAQLQRMAQMNGVETRVEIGRYCTHADLERLSVGKTLLISDVEGFETELLDPDRAPSLKRNDELVEIHEQSDDIPETERLITRRFLPTHTIERMVEQSRDGWLEKHAPELATRIGDEQTRAAATAEHRATGRVWLWMQANQG